MAAAQSDASSVESTSSEDSSSVDESGEQAEAGEEATEESPETNELGLTEEELGGKCLPSCEPGSRCQDGKCVSLCEPGCGPGEVCTGTGICERLGAVAQQMDEAARKREEERRDRTLEGLRGFGGLVVGAGLSVHSFKLPGRDKLDDPTTSAALLFALKGGIMVDVAEFSVEWAPGTFVPVTGGDDNVTDEGEWIGSLIGNFGFHLPLTDMVYWPVRIGAGYIPANGRNDFLGRIDLVNISVKTKYVLFDVSLPSVRYTSDFDDYHRWTGLFLASASYISQ